jgi:hypothetical protein
MTLWRVFLDFFGNRRLRNAIRRNTRAAENLDRAVREMLNP